MAAAHCYLQISVFLAAYTIIFVAMIVWQIHVPSYLTVNPTGTAPGICLVVIRTVGAGWLVAATYVAYSQLIVV